MSKHTSIPKSEKCIGAFDSGVGGLSVLRELIKILPNEEVVYVADQKNVPYGKKTLEQVRRYSERITRFLIGKGAKIIMIPCHTATGAALDYLRETFPEMLFVGMEPAVKPAVEASKTQKIGVLATAGTFKSQRYEKLVERYGRGIEVMENPCLGLVELIEEGKTTAPETENFLKKVTEPMVANGVDAIVLGCTHYPFIQPLLEKILPEKIKIIDPAPAVAKQVQRRLEKQNLLNKTAPGKRWFYTTGEVKIFKKSISNLTDLKGEIRGLRF